MENNPNRVSINLTKLKAFHLALQRGACLALLTLGLFITNKTHAQDAFIQVTPRLVQDTVEQYGRRAGSRLEAWQELVEENQSRDVKKKLRVVNDFFNRIPHKTDQEHWGVDDYWASPIEFLASNGGDCEDYTIAKYITLRALGIPDSQLRLNYVRAEQLAQGVPHMVLTYAESEGNEENKQTDPLVLDNLSAWVRPASQRRDLAVVYNFNGKSLWYSDQLGGGDERLGDSVELDNWAEFLKRYPLP